MSRSSYAPNESDHTIREEVTWLQGAFLGNLLCGVQITLSVMSFLAVLKQPIRRRLRIAFLVYVFFLCATITVGQQFNLLFVQMGFIDSRNYPGGPNAFLSEQYETPVDLASTTLFMFANWMIESLLVWRCKVVCTTGDRPIWIAVAIPIALLVSQYVTGSLFLYQLYETMEGEYVRNFGVAYSSLSLLLNITVTSIIAGRLLLHRRRMVRLFGPGHGSNYASAATIMIESASLYTGFIILFIIFSCVGTPASNILQQIGVHVEGIASLLIIYRIALGKGWRDDVGVSSADWRGDSAPRVEPEVVNLEMVAGAVQASVHAPSIPSKKDETPTSTSVRSLAQDNVV